jgi:hypothetical protein
MTRINVNVAVSRSSFPHTRRHSRSATSFGLITAALRLVAALRRAARERGGPLPSMVVADALLDQRRELTERATNSPREFSQFPM